MERHYYDVLLVADGVAKVIHSLSPSVKDQGPAAAATEAVDGLNIAVKSFDRDYPQNTFHPETAVYVAGELSSNDEIKRLIQQSTGRPVAPLKPALEIPADMNPEMYAACLGLASKGSMSKVASPYYDIDLNLLSPSKKTSSAPFRLSYVLYPAIIALLAFLVYKSYTMKADADARIADLKRDSVQATQLMATSQKANADAAAARQAGTDKLQAMQTELNSLNSEAAKIMARKYNYGNAIDLVTVSLPQSADYVNMSVRADGIQVEGHVTNIFDVLNFTEALERTGSFASARAEEITPLADAPGANFRVIVKTK
jgi:Tfp pilus assembly protein PilN